MVRFAPLQVTTRLEFSGDVLVYSTGGNLLVARDVGPNVVMGLEGVGINTTPPVITDGAVLIDGGVKIGTHLLKSTNQGLDVAGVRLDDGDLISNTSISDLVLQRVGEIMPLFWYRTTKL
jgi:hypothetical protein